MNVQHLLDEERERENRSTQRRMPRHRVALLLGAVGAVIAIGTGSALTAAAAASITEYDELNAVAEASSPVITPPTELAPSAILPAETATETAAEAPAAAAAEETVVDEAAATEDPAPGGIATILGHTVYDETTDLALIPRPSPEFIEEWALDFDTIVMQAHLDALCMADKGFKAAFLPIWDTWESGDTMEAVGALDAFNDSRNPEWQLAMWGADDQPLGEDYDWKQAGCHGASVHDTGMDDAH